MLIAEGGYYCLAVTFLMVTIGSLILKLVATYMKGQLSYFEYTYPYAWMLALAGGMWGINIGGTLAFKPHRTDTKSVSNDV